MKNTTVRICASIVLTVLFGAVQLIAQKNPQPAPSPAKPPVRHPLDKGDFKVGFSPKTKAKDPKKDMPKELKDVFQEVADGLNELLAMPKNIYINMDACGEPNAFYSPDASEITFCYELLEQYEAEFKTIEKDQEKVDSMVVDTLVQTLFHELGHCLIDVWELPATGREEDAVDQLATILMLDGTDEGTQSTINAALEFDIASRDQDPNDMAYWDEHSFSKTRFYDMICLVYGSNEKANAWMVGPNTLPNDRAVRCGEEHRRAERSWLKLLDPYIKK
ncbi:MAG: hypothetical protein KBD94_08605 [Pyrinomonadaceae bacterium]|nr:hypothetical protein [Pyrinomonadaceae bacterium]